MTRTLPLMALALLLSLPASASEQPPAPLAAPRPQVHQAPLSVIALKPGQKTPSGPARQAPEVIGVALNKTTQIDLPAAVRDIVVGNPEVAEVLVRSNTQLFLQGRKIGDTNLFVMDSAGHLIRRIEVNVHPDTDAVKDALARLLPDDRLDVAGTGDTLVLSGSVRSDGVAAQARAIARRFVSADDKVISMIKVAADQQVLLQVRVAEMQKSVLKELGMTNTLTSTGLGGGLAGSLALSTTPVGLGTEIAGVVTASALNNLTNSLRMLEKQGLVKNLAEPNLMAVSGESASMLAGGEYPIPVPDKDTIKIEYKPFGVSLSFLPVVLDSGAISLKIATEVSALSSTNSVQVPFSTGTITIKAFTVRRANSTVELPSGGSVMIAGMLQNDIVSGLNGMPGAMDIPIIGSLLRSSSFQRAETELVVMVSAMLAKPVDPKQIALPTDGFAPASDMDQIFLGKLHEVYVKRPLDTRGGNPLQGPVGYIVE
ncbi:Type II and III secretion system protein [Magnetospirillum sp. LM-5]|uniref:type II and III secretion system protein family protein n=1 Tax=Magnetospirillum sp. LM-5 TaxID=2681466 RepID=UPI0013813A6C|nr:type II and III secretion system protein family protein [Magnetospirillum sp. LM-5]CAA7623942.1 Type II and III secretion system protein [Magnetospirillum sp. LM-5]